MSGMRALDVATFDGFWSFEMERRGADVVAVDIPRWADADIPLRLKERLQRQELEGGTGAGFRLARELLGSRVERREASVYDLTPEDLGRFDVVLISDLLQHLRDPHRALERVFSLTEDVGCAIVAEVYDEELEACSGAPVVRLGAWVDYAWTIASPAALKLMLNVAGFNPVEEVSRFRLENRFNSSSPKIVLKAHPWQRSRLVT
jgi:tRNA (mo5U34)-methyltransferase